LQPLSGFIRIEQKGRLAMTEHDDSMYVEKFTPTDLIQLRNELLQPGVDSFQAAAIVCNFLSGRGYGIAPDEARSVVTRIDSHDCTPALMQAELERVARAA
jgi:hypothetical protein